MLIVIAKFIMKNQNIVSHWFENGNWIRYLYLSSTRHNHDVKYLENFTNIRTLKTTYVHSRKIYFEFLLSNWSFHRQEINPDQVCRHNRQIIYNAGCSKFSYIKNIVILLRHLLPRLTNISFQSFYGTVLVLVFPYKFIKIRI